MARLSVLGPPPPGHYDRNLGPGSGARIYFVVPASRGHIGMMLHTRIDTILFGALLALLWESKWFHAELDRFARPWLLLAATAFLFVGSPLIRQRFRGAYDLPFGITIDSAIIALLVTWSILHPASTVRKNAESPRCPSCRSHFLQHLPLAANLFRPRQSLPG